LSFQTQLDRADRFGHWREKETFAAKESRRQAPIGCRQQILDNAIQGLYGCQSVDSYCMAVNSYGSICQQT